LGGAASARDVASKIESDSENNSFAALHRNVAGNGFQIACALQSRIERSVSLRIQTTGLQ
jgi:hypothetical protein